MSLNAPAFMASVLRAARALLAKRRKSLRIASKTATGTAEFTCTRLNNYRTKRRNSPQTPPLSAAAKNAARATAMRAHTLAVIIALAAASPSLPSEGSVEKKGKELEGKDAVAAAARVAAERRRVPRGQPLRPEGDADLPQGESCGRRADVARRGRRPGRRLGPLPRRKAAESAARGHVRFAGLRSMGGLVRLS